MLNDNTEHHSGFIFSSKNAIDSIAHHHVTERKRIKNSLNPSHSFSKFDKFPVWDKICEKEEMNVMFGFSVFLFSRTSMTNEQGYGTTESIREFAVESSKAFRNSMREDFSNAEM